MPNTSYAHNLEWHVDSNKGDMQNNMWNNINDQLIRYLSIRHTCAMLTIWTNAIQNLYDKQKLFLSKVVTLSDAGNMHA